MQADEQKRFPNPCSPACTHIYYEDKTLDFRPLIRLLRMALSRPDFTTNNYSVLALSRLTDVSRQLGCNGREMRPNCPQRKGTFDDARDA